MSLCNYTIIIIIIAIWDTWHNIVIPIIMLCKQECVSWRGDVGWWRGILTLGTWCRCRFSSHDVVGCRRASTERNASLWPFTCTIFCSRRGKWLTVSRSSSEASSARGKEKTRIIAKLGPYFILRTTKYIWRIIIFLCDIVNVNHVY